MVLFGWMDSSFHYHNDTWTYELSNILYVEKVSPSNGILDLSLSSNVNISFSEVMDRGATERAVTLTPKVPMSASWDISGKVLSLASGSTLESGASVAIHISTNATSADGHSMRYSYAFSLVILKPVPAPTVDAQTVLIVMGIVTAVAVATAIGLSEWLLYSALILLLPLYVKIKRGRVLDNFVRGRIYQFIIHCPGAHLRFIKKTLGVEMGTLSYHLNVLERSGMIRSERRGNLKRFFYTKKEGGSGLNEYQSLQKDILDELNLKPGQGIRALSAILNKDRQVVAFCVHDMLDKQVLIDKRTIRGIMFQPRAQLS
jgi:predicted transcriptional regulator